MKKLNFLLVALMATVLLCSSFTGHTSQNVKTSAKVKFAGVAVGKWYWVDPATPDLYQEFTVYVDFYDQTQVTGLKLVGTSSLRGATGTYSGTGVYNVNSPGYSVVNGYGSVY